MKRGIYRTLFQWGFAALLILLLFCFGDVSNLVRLQDVRWNAFLMVFLCNTAFSIAHNFRWKLIVDHLSGEKEQGTVGPGFHHPSPPGVKLTNPLPENKQKYLRFWNPHEALRIRREEGLE